MRPARPGRGVGVLDEGLREGIASSAVALAIPAAGSLSHLGHNMAAARITLTEEDLADLA